MAIHEVIQDELKNSLRMESDYARRLAGLPKGNLVKKRIGKRDYWYLQWREGEKVHFTYVRKPSPAVIQKYARAKIDRRRYRSLMSQVRKQIRQMRKMLRHGQSI